MKDKEKSERVLYRSETVGDEMYRVTKNGTVATVWRCRSNGVWRELREMPIDDFERWAVDIGLLQATPEAAVALLKALAAKVAEKVNNS